MAAVTAAAKADARLGFVVQSPRPDPTPVGVDADESPGQGSRGIDVPFPASCMVSPPLPTFFGPDAAALSPGSADMPVWTLPASGAPLRVAPPDTIEVDTHPIATRLLHGVARFLTERLGAELPVTEEGAVTRVHLGHLATLAERVIAAELVAALVRTFAEGGDAWSLLGAWAVDPNTPRPWVDAASAAGEDGPTEGIDGTPRPGTAPLALVDDLGLTRVHASAAALVLARELPSWSAELPDLIVIPATGWEDRVHAALAARGGDRPRALPLVDVPGVARWARGWGVDATEGTRLLALGPLRGDDRDRVISRLVRTVGNAADLPVVEAVVGNTHATGPAIDRPASPRWEWIGPASVRSAAPAGPAPSAPSAPFDARPTSPAPSPRDDTTEDASARPGEAGKPKVAHDDIDAASGPHGEIGTARTALDDAMASPAPERVESAEVAANASDAPADAQEEAPPLVEAWHGGIVDVLDAQQEGVPVLAAAGDRPERAAELLVRVFGLSAELARALVDGAPCRLPIAVDAMGMDRARAAATACPGMILGWGHQGENEPA